MDDFLGELDNVKSRWKLPWCIGGNFLFVFPVNGKVRVEIVE